MRWDWMESEPCRPWSHLFLVDDDFPELRRYQARGRQAFFPQDTRNHSSEDRASERPRSGGSSRRRCRGWSSILRVRMPSRLKLCSWAPRSRSPSSSHTGGSFLISLRCSPGRIKGPDWHRDRPCLGASYLISSSRDSGRVPECGHPAAKQGMIHRRPGRASVDVDHGKDRQSVLRVHDDREISYTARLAVAAARLGVLVREAGPAL